MGLVDTSDTIKGPAEIYAEFAGWLDKHLSNGLPSDIAAVHFNLYEGVNMDFNGGRAESSETYDVQLAGCDRFDASDGDWPCSEVFTTGEDLFSVPRTKNIAHRERGLSYVTALVKKYLDEGEFADTLKGYAAVGIGFEGGDTQIICRS